MNNNDTPAFSEYINHCKKTAELNLLKGNIILYDGYCNLCDSTIQTVLKYDKYNSFQYLPLQAVEVREFLKTKFDSEKLPDSVILLSDGEIFIKSEAIFKIIQHLGVFFKMLYIFKILPGRLNDTIYDWIARNRFKWFGKKGNCKIQTF